MRHFFSENEINNLKEKQRFETTFTDGVTFAGLFNKFEDGSYIQIFDDITDLKTNEKKLLENEKRFLLMAEAINAYIFDWDIKNKKVMQTHPAKRNMLTTVSEKEAFDFVLEEDREDYKIATINHFKNSNDNYYILFMLGWIY